MNFSGQQQNEVQKAKVVSLFSYQQNEEVTIPDPLETLLDEAAGEEESFARTEVTPRKIASEKQFPDQSLFVLEEQLQHLRKSLNRMKFYLNEIEDILPKNL
jgi:hypothetical protein